MLTIHADVFEAVQSGNAIRGVIPFENSTNGAVIPTLELLADRNSLYKDLNVCGEYYLDVHHYLMGHKAPVTGSPDLSGTSTPTLTLPAPLKPRAKPLSSLKHIVQIHTHPQAYGQCEIFLGAYLKGIDRSDESSTSRSAQIVKGDDTGTHAAIASKLAAETLGLDILAECIEDNADNTTRFLILRNGADNSIREEPDLPTKSLISFTVDHTSPGALADVLQCFRHEKLNLTSINSRPSGAGPFQYIFFIEFEGSRLQDQDGRVERALSSVGKFAQYWRWLGSWNDQSRKP